MAIVLNDSFGLRYHLVDCVNTPISTFPLFPGFNPLPNMTSLQIAPSEIQISDLSLENINKIGLNNFMTNTHIGESKKKTIFTCEVCGLEFLSKIVLETHIAGSKHQRKVKAKDLMQNLERNESGFEKDHVSGVIRCTVCDVTVNSPQLLATHIAGNRHRLRKRKREEVTSASSKKQCTAQGVQENGESSNTGSSQSGDSAASPPISKKKEKKERATLQIDIPEHVTKLEESKAGGKYLCNPCQAHCNSDTQLSQHLSSKKHLDKVNLKSKPPFGEHQPHYQRASRFQGTRGVRGRSQNGLCEASYDVTIEPFKAIPVPFYGAVDSPEFRGRGRGCFPWRGGPSNYPQNRSAYTYTEPLSQNFVRSGSFAAK